MENLNMIPYVILLIAVTGVIGGAASITVSEFGDTMTPCFNSSYKLNDSLNPAGLQFCFNNTAEGNVVHQEVGQAGLNLSNEFYTKTVTQDGVGTIMEQTPTVAIIAAMVIIISVIAGVFTYLRFFR